MYNSHKYKVNRQNVKNATLSLKLMTPKLDIILYGPQRSVYQALKLIRHEMHSSRWSNPNANGGVTLNRSIHSLSLGIIINGP